ncbi:MAG: UDP-N-acetylmuramoyl-tripeptide--D-alanyl-D-alanine ligase [Holosporales bacterium]|jgi:UDP-N-acetylmuramoyl-tripeptide--D-alanyl-D-alanine ligase|nr:UDP-N-acetylmuramoyl-tripeptide--D-alanyl-D-alanine ligase [Holosporales bacterium]
MTSLFSAQELHQVLGISPQEGVTGVAIDSRFVKPGDLFFALRGDHQDGHAFIPQAISAGARVIVAERPLSGSFVVPDSYAALCTLAQYARDRCTGTVVGITGTVGKTSLKEALKTVLSPFGSVHASERSFNNRWGVPLTLSNLPHDTSYSLVEIGSNHPGEIASLATLVQHNGAVLTGIEVGHTAFFGSLSGVAQEKMMILEMLKPGDWAVFPEDSPYADALRKKAQAQGARAITFGTQEQATVRLCSWTCREQTSTVTVQILGKTYHYTVSLPGEPGIINSACVLAVGQALGLPCSDLLPALQTLTPLEGRGKRLQLSLPGERTVTLFDETYNANPPSMQAALKILGLQTPTGEGRRLAVLGDMGELGESAVALHQNLVPTLGKAGIDKVFCCGPLMKKLYAILATSRQGVWTETAQDLAPLVEEQLKAGDIVLIKGSRSLHMEEIIHFLTKRVSQ